MRCVAIVLDDRVGDRTRSSLRGPDGSPSLPARPSASRRSRGPTNRGSTPSLQLGAGSADILMPGRQRVGGCTEFRRCAATTASNHPQSRLISSPSTDSPSPARCRSVRLCQQAAAHHVDANGAHRPGQPPIRSTQDAVGDVATVVSGVVTRRSGQRHRRSPRTTGTRAN